MAGVCLLVTDFAPAPRRRYDASKGGVKSTIPRHGNALVNVRSITGHVIANPKPAHLLAEDALRKYSLFSSWLAHQVAKLDHDLFCDALRRLIEGQSSSLDLRLVVGQLRLLLSRRLYERPRRFSCLVYSALSSANLLPHCLSPVDLRDQLYDLIMFPPVVGDNGYCISECC